MKTKLLSFLFTLLVFGTTNAHAGNWFKCGVINQINPLTFQIAGFPTVPPPGSPRGTVSYEYGIAFNSVEPYPINITSWNQGTRIANKEPYFVNSDTPMAGMNYGGFMFLNGTASPQDDACTSAGGYFHHYWQLSTNNVVVPTFGSNGCFTSEIPIYCRAR